MSSNLNHESHHNVLNEHHPLQSSPYSKLTHHFELKDKQTSKNEHSKTDQNHYDVANEQDYSRMLQLFSQYDRPSNFKRELTILMSCLNQFTSKDLLSNSYLWNIPEDNYQLCHYVDSIHILESFTGHIYLIENKKNPIVMIQINGVKQFMECHPIAVRVYKQRQQFMKKLDQRRLNVDESLLTQINKQILFLYKQFFEQKKQIASKLKEIQQEIASPVSLTSAQYLHNMKTLHEQLLELKQTKNKKTKCQS